MFNRRHGIFASQKSVYTLNFSDVIAFDFIAETNSQDIPSTSTLYMTVFQDSGSVEVYWSGSSGDVIAWDASGYTNRTLSVSANDSLRFTFLSFGGAEGGVEIRLTDASGPIVSSFAFFLTG
jgi:hypothetical protein